MIFVDHLTKEYGPTRALDKVTFMVAPGETVGFLGPNGAGKTTTMRIMTALFPPSSGDVTIDGYSVRTHPLEVKRRIGYLSESAPLYGEMSVEGYLRFVAEAKTIPTGLRAESIRAVVKECGLESVRRRSTRTLSKGFRQRVGLAQALLGDPPVIILDEPTAGLDPTQTAEFRRLLVKLKGERTIILSTHILHEVSMICDRVVIIAEGKVLAQDSPENLARRLFHSSELLVTIEAPEGELMSLLSGIEGVARVEVTKRFNETQLQYRLVTSGEIDPRDELIRLLVARDWRLLELQPVSAGLEEVFLNLVNGGESSP